MASVRDATANEERAAWRRTHWQAGVWGGREAAASDARRFWADASATMRFDAVVQMALESEILKGHEPPDRLQRSIGGVRR